LVTLVFRHGGKFKNSLSEGESEITRVNRKIQKNSSLKNVLSIKNKLLLQRIYLHISGVILQNLDWLQLKFDFVSGTATISTEFSSGLKFPPISNETAA
jgi:hypothetical protein